MSEDDKKTLTYVEKLWCEKIKSLYTCYEGDLDAPTDELVGSLRTRIQEMWPW